MDRPEKLRRLIGPPRRKPASPIERLKAQMAERMDEWAKALRRRKGRISVAQVVSRQGTVEYAMGALAGFSTAYEMILKLEARLEREGRGVPDEATPHAPLECPECGRVTRPRGERRGGGASYRCLNAAGHANHRPISFFIDGDGELFF